MGNNTFILKKMEPDFKNIDLSSDDKLLLADHSFYQHCAEKYEILSFWPSFHYWQLCPILPTPSFFFFFTQYRTNDLEVEEVPKAQGSSIPEKRRKEGLPPLFLLYPQHSKYCLHRADTQ